MEKQTASIFRIDAAKQDRLIALLTANPGLNGLDLKAKGYREASHGSLVDAERGGWIIFRGGGWYLKGQTFPSFDRQGRAIRVTVPE